MAQWLSRIRLTWIPVVCYRNVPASSHSVSDASRSENSVARSGDPLSVPQIAPGAPVELSARKGTDLRLLIRGWIGVRPPGGWERRRLPGTMA